jgi:hypothetical protein
MDTIKKHQLIIAEYIKQLSKQLSSASGNVLEYQVITDFENNHYQLVQLGWNGKKFFYQILIHLDIKPDSGKIWIQQNNTEILIGEDLKERGIDNSEIVLGFRPSYLRQMTPFAVS